MNFRDFNENVSKALRVQRWMLFFSKSIFGQNSSASLDYVKPSPMLSLSACRVAIYFCLGLLLLTPISSFSQTNYYTTNGLEYAIVGSLLGDQVFPDVAVNASGGFVVWQDNATDGSGWGVSAERVDSTLSGSLGTFRVNATGTNDQQNAHVALLKGGGAVFVWQGGLQGYQQIYTRFLTPTNTWMTTNDVLVNSSTNYFQNYPAVAVLNNSNVVVVWAGFNKAGNTSLLDVYGQMFSPSGQKIGTNFLINQFISYNQRTPAITALNGGGFVVTWVSEQERASVPSLGTNTTYTSASASPTPSADIFARLYDASGSALGNEFLVNSNYYPCANPSVASGSDGGFLVTWSAADVSNTTNGWDIYARSYSSNGVGSSVALVNTTVIGNQFLPRVSSIGQEYLVVWTSVGQDGSREGVFGQFLHGINPVGNEFKVNTTTLGQQLQPVVASDGASQFLVIWTSYTGSPYSFDLYAQRYINVSVVLLPMSAPFVWSPFVVSNNVYQPQLVVSWPTLLGISVSNYEVYVDGSSTPMGVTTSNSWTMTAANGLTTNSVHSFQLDYVTTAGGRAPLSPSSIGATWLGLNWGGIPYEWMAQFFGGYYSGSYHTSFWPSASSPAASGGPTLQQVFMSGGNPFDSSTWLTTTLSNTAQGMFLSWNTLPGATYQVQVTTDLKNWNNVGSPRFAAGNTDSIFVGGSPAGYYRVMLMR